MLRLPAGRETSLGDGAPQYQRHRPERTLLYQLVEQYYPVFETQWAAEGRILPDYVRQEFEEYLKSGRLEHGFLRVRCDTCHAEHLVAFSCKGRGFCPSCGARRMAESAALLVDDVLPHEPMAAPAHLTAIAHGKDCSCNPPAFPPSMAVRCARAAIRGGQMRGSGPQFVSRWRLCRRCRINRTVSLGQGANGLGASEKSPRVPSGRS